MTCIFCILYFFIFNSVTIFPIEGFKLGSEKHTTEAIVKKSGALQVTSGIAGLAFLKTTKVS
jgi:cell division septal protein FtsQ